MRPGEDKLDELQVTGTWAGWNTTCQIAELKQMLRKPSWLTGQALASGFETENLNSPTEIWGYKVHTTDKLYYTW